MTWIRAESTICRMILKILLNLLKPLLGLFAYCYTEQEIKVSDRKGSKVKVGLAFNKAIQWFNNKGNIFIL